MTVTPSSPPPPVATGAARDAFFFDAAEAFGDRRPGLPVAGGPCNGTVSEGWAGETRGTTARPASALGGLRWADGGGGLTTGATLGMGTLILGGVTSAALSGPPMLTMTKPHQPTL